MPTATPISIPGLEAVPHMMTLLGKSLETSQKDMIEIKKEAADAQKRMNELMEKQQEQYDDTNSKVSLTIGNEHAMMEKIEKASQPQLG